MIFYFCRHCGNIVVYAENKGLPLTCCGEVMKELVPYDTESEDFGEYDMPISSYEGVAIVAVGSRRPHPMTPEHYIKWVVLETKEGKQRKDLLPTDDSLVKFAISPTDEVVAAYAYCNVHGLAKAMA